MIISRNHYNVYKASLYIPIALKRGDLYNQSLEDAIELKTKDIVLIVAPISKFVTFNKEKEPLDILYKKGYKATKAIVNFMD